MRGNNELKLLAHARPVLRLFSADEVLRRKDLLQDIASWPLVVDFLERHLKWISPQVDNPNLPA